MFPGVKLYTVGDCIQTQTRELPEFPASKIDSSVRAAPTVSLRSVTRGSRSEAVRCSRYLLFLQHVLKCCISIFCRFDISVSNYSRPV